MLLETLDVKKNDILIYSENKFDFDNNFKIIYKKAASKKPYSINFWEVGEYINSTTPKSMILYRLLTNMPDFNANLTKFGTFIQINSRPEVVYYDPVFAVRELERLNAIIDFQRFRFKIHQIGLTSSSLQNGHQNYRELYHFDLKADEAKNQNDKVFAEAIFAFDNDFGGGASESYSDVFETPKISATSSPYKPLNLMLGEDRTPQERELQKMDVFPDMSVVAEAREKVNYYEREVPENENRQETSIGEFLKRQKLKESEHSSQSSGDNLLSLFKSSDNYVNGRSGESVILQFKKG